MLLAALFLTVGIASAQVTESIRGLHKVKKKETIFGISRMYDITIEQLIEANPEMKAPDYELKKGTVLRIPFATTQPQAQETPKQEVVAANDVRNREIRLGVMLPLHDINGDGKRMVEYYRGVLMACDSVKKLGISVNVHAWNTPEDWDIRQTLLDENAAKCDIIIGPLYSKQMEALSSFVEKHDIQLVIPFSINAPQLTTNRHIFQIYQTPNEITEASVNRFVEQFRDFHTVIIDCNDSTSKKGPFTTGIRRQMEQHGNSYSLTSLKSDEDAFSKAFSRTKSNVVVLNTARSQELGVAFSKINGLKVMVPELNITMFGYTEWLMYTHKYLENFYKYNTYIPSTFNYNPLTTATQRIEQKYRWNFHSDMQNRLPRLAITGFDQAYFFLRGLNKYGKTFNGATGMLGYAPVQTPLQFERYGNGGLRNKMLIFVHYTPDHRVETIKF